MHLTVSADKSAKESKLHKAPPLTKKRSSKRQKTDSSCGFRETFAPRYTGRPSKEAELETLEKKKPKSKEKKKKQAEEEAKIKKKDDENDIIVTEGEDSISDKEDF